MLSFRHLKQISKNVVDATFNEKRLENYLQNTNWDDALEIHSEDVDKSFETFF